MTNGTVKFFNAAKGFGFITPDDGGKDVFVPAASIASSGMSSLKPGQRVAFEVAPDAKGPKAIELKLIAAAPKTEKAPAPAEPGKGKPVLTIYLDPASDSGRDALDELHDAGLEPRLVDYIANPPSKDELKALSLRLRDSDQSLVKRYDPLFLELRLDDRFISDSEYWGAIHEHPTLINGPVLATAARASVCRSETAVKAFLAAMTSGAAPAAPKPKALSDRLLQLVNGHASLPAIVASKAPEPEQPVEREQKKTKAPAEVKPKGTAKVTVKAAAKVAAKPKPKVKAAVAAKKAAPAKKAVKARKK